MTGLVPQRLSADEARAAYGAAVAAAAEHRETCCGLTCQDGMDLARAARAAELVADATAARKPAGDARRFDGRPLAHDAAERVYRSGNRYRHPDEAELCPNGRHGHHHHGTAVTCELASMTKIWEATREL